MGSILALLNVIILGQLTDEELVNYFGLSPSTTSVDKAKVIGLVIQEISNQYENIQPEKLMSVSSNGLVIDDHPWDVVRRVYRTLSNMELHPDCPPLANIVLVGTMERPVSLTTIHLVSQMIKAHNLIGHPTKVQLVISNLREIAVI